MSGQERPRVHESTVRVLSEQADAVRAGLHHTVLRVVGTPAARHEDRLLARRPAAPAAQASAPRRVWRGTALIAAWVAISIVGGALIRSAAIEAIGWFALGAGTLVFLNALMALGRPAGAAQRSAVATVAGGVALVVTGVYTLVTRAPDWNGQSRPAGWAMVPVALAGASVATRLARLTTGAVRSVVGIGRWIAFATAGAGATVWLQGTPWVDDLAGIAVGLVTVVTGAVVGVRAARTPYGDLPRTTEVGYLSLRSPVTWGRLTVLSAVGGLAYNMLYGVYAVAGSIAAATGIPEQVIVVLPAVGISVAVTVLLPYTALRSWLTPASLVGMAGIALLIGRADGWAVIPLIIGGGCCFLAPFSLWARVGATLPKGETGRRAGQLYVGMMLTAVAGTTWVFGRAVGEIGPGTRERVEDVFLAFAIALTVGAVLAWWLTPRLPQAEIEARRRKTGHPIVRPWRTLRDPQIRRVAWLYGLSGAALGMFDATITLGVLAAMLTEEHAAGTGIAIVLGGLVAPFLNSVIRSGRTRMLIAGCITLCGFPVAALFGGTGAAAAALLPALVVGRIAVEDGTSQTTMAGPDVVRGDEDVMSVLQAFKAGLSVPGVLLGAVLFTLGPHVGLTGWRLVLIGAELMMLTYLALAVGLPREQPIVEELPDGAGYAFWHGRQRSLVLLRGATTRVLKSAVEATLTGIRPSRVFYAYGRAEGTSVGRAELRLGSDLLERMASLAMAWRGVTGVTNTDVAWVGRFVGVVGVDVANASEDVKEAICESLAHQLQEQLGLGLALVGERDVPRSPAWRTRTRALRLAGRHAKAVTIARLAGLRPLRRTSPTWSWMRIGDQLGVGNILGGQVRSACERYGVQFVSWSSEPVDDGWKLLVVAEGADRQLARLEAYLATSLRLTGFSAVDVERRPAPVTA